MFLTLSFRFVGNQYHAMTAGKLPEWPPTPLRAFNALVASAGPVIASDSADALRWLETLGAPVLCTPGGHPGKGLTSYVEDNYQEPKLKSRSEISTSEKDIYPTVMVGDPLVQFIWTVEDTTPDILHHVEVLSGLARGIPYLGQACNVGHGWMTFGPEAQHTGNVWVPGQGQGVAIPCEGTFDALCRRHREKEANRGTKGLVRVGDLCQRDIARYSRVYDLQGPRSLVFDLLDLTGSGFVTWNTPTEGYKVAGMLRHALKTAAENSGWPQDKINSTILGHGPDGPRFILCPLPSRQRGEGFDKVTEIRRVLITGSPKEMVWAERVLSGVSLVDETSKLEVALLSPTREDSGVMQSYLHHSFTHTTVTPVCIPRVKTATIEGLLRHAMHYAGLPDELALGSDLEWSLHRGFLPGTEAPGDYHVRDTLRKSLRVHVRITWRDHNGAPVRVPGPICLGNGRFHGTGLLVGD
jgi:CRISPR-associated protein Csb2